MDWIIFIGILVAIGAIFVGIYGQRRSMFNRPKLFVKLGRQPGWTFQEGTLNASAKRGEPPSATGEYRGHKLRLTFEYQQLDGGNYSATHPHGNTGDATSMEHIRTLVDTGIELSSIWQGIELHEETISVIRDEITGADQPIGDPGFDDDFILTGSVTDEVRQRLLDDDVQRTLRSFEEQCVIKDGFLLIRQTIDGTGVDQLEPCDVQKRGDELIDAVQILDAYEDSDRSW